MAIYNSYASKLLPADDDTVLIYDSETGKNKQMRYGDLAKAIIEQFSNEFLERYKALIGTPLTASTVSQMEDEEKIYVYTGSETGYTAGHWYYYNVSAWTDGGVYNAVAVSTDKTLTVPDKAADAKVVGDEIADLKTLINKAVPTLDANGIVVWS